MVLLLSFLLSTVRVLSDTGTISVRTQSGVVVYVDGIEYGTSTDEGLLLPGIRVGPHELRFAIPGGGSSTTQVTVEKEQTTTINVSAMALQSAPARKGGLEVKLTTADQGCVVSVAGQQKPMVDSLAGFYDLVPNTYAVGVTCGARSVGSNVTVAPGRIALMDANPILKIMRVTGDRPRTPQQLTVASSQDKLAQSSIPAAAKRALIAAMPSGIQVADVRAFNGGLVHLTLVTSNLNDVHALVERLEESDQFDKVQIGHVSKDGGNRYRIEVGMLIAW